MWMLINAYKFYGWQITSSWHSSPFNTFMMSCILMNALTNFSWISSFFLSINFGILFLESLLIIKFFLISKYYFSSIYLKTKSIGNMIFFFDRIIDTEFATFRNCKHNGIVNGEWVRLDISFEHHSIKCVDRCRCTFICVRIFLAHFSIQTLASLWFFWTKHLYLLIVFVICLLFLG